MSVDVIELSPKGIRAEMKRLKACIREIDETRVAPFEDCLRELLAAAWASPAGIVRNVAALEIEALWRQIDQLNDAPLALRDGANHGGRNLQ